MKTVAFFNNKGGVGKTSLVYHLAWMFRELGVPVLAADLDPQANLTAMFLDEARLEEIWPESGTHSSTIYGALEPIAKGIGDIAIPQVENVADGLDLLPGDLALASFEERLSSAWPGCFRKFENDLRTTTAFHRVLTGMAAGRAELVLIDVGPNLGAINRAAILAADHICVPLAPDLFSLQGLRNLGPTLVQWHDDWQKILSMVMQGLDVPAGAMQPMGYVVMQHGMRDNRPVKVYRRWMQKIPAQYASSLLRQAEAGAGLSVDRDPRCLAQLKHFRSLMPLAMEAHKPMFALKPADGAIGAHVAAVRDCYDDFRRLALKIAEVVGLPVEDHAGTVH